MAVFVSLSACMLVCTCFALRRGTWFVLHVFLCISRLPLYSHHIHHKQHYRIQNGGHRLDERKEFSDCFFCWTKKWCYVWVAFVSVFISSIILGRAWGYCVRHILFAFPVFGMIFLSLLLCLPSYYLLYLQMLSLVYHEKNQKEKKTFGLFFTSLLYNNTVRIFLEL